MRHIARLEKIAVRAIERAGDWEVVQYRGEILPLLEAQRIEYTEVKVRPISDLPPQRQAELRGLRD